MAPVPQHLQGKDQRSKANATYSPRSAALVQSVVELLGPYNYGEADIYALVKKCGFDDRRVQTAVSNILDDKMGHENDDWATTATASDKKVRAQEAKERRIEKEKIQAEEMERLREQRQRDYDEKERRLKEEAARLKQQTDIARLKRPPEASAVKSIANAWKRSEETVADVASTPTAPTGGGEETLSGEGGDRESAEGEDDGVEEQEQEAEEDLDDEYEEEEAPKEQVWADTAGEAWEGWSARPWQPDSSENGATGWGENGGKGWNSSGWGSSAALPRPVQEPTSAAAPTEQTPAEESPCVIMPPQYYALMRSGPEYEVVFGSLHPLEIGTGSAVSSSQPAPQAASEELPYESTELPTQHEEQHSSWAEAEVNADDFFEERGAPRGGRGGFGGKSRGRGRGGSGGAKGKEGKEGKDGKDNGKAGKKGSGRGGKGSGRGGKGTWRPENQRKGDGK